MPKVRNTRRQRAVVLIERLIEGPATFDYPGQYLGQSEVFESYQRWVNSWILPEIRDLVPELRKKKDRSERQQ